MKPIVKILLRRSLMTLSAIVVWAKALARGSADGQTRSMPETDQKTAGDRQPKPNRGSIPCCQMRDVTVKTN